MSQVNNHDIFNELAIRHDISRAKAASIYDDMIELIRGYLKDGHDVVFNGFCAFTNVHRGPRKARNPRTNETFMTEPKTVVKVRTRSRLNDLSDASGLADLPEGSPEAEALAKLKSNWIEPKLVA